MAAADLPGFAMIESEGLRLGVPGISETVKAARMLMQTDPDAIQAASERLRTYANGQPGLEQLRQATTTVEDTGWLGVAADFFGTKQVTDATNVAAVSSAAGQLASRLDDRVSVYRQDHHVIETVTGTTVMALLMLATARP